MFKIGDFSKLAQVSVKTLRYYDQLKLLQPTWTDRFSGYRYYTLAQLPRLNRILALKDLGFSLEQIQKLLQEDLPATELRGMMRMKQAEIERQIEAEQFRLTRIETRLRQIEREGAMPTYEVVLKSVASQKIAGIRRVLENYQSLKQLFGELHRMIDAKMVDTAQQSGLPIMPSLAIYYDAEYRDREIDVEVAVPFSGRLQLSSHLVVHELPGYETMACAAYQGDCDGLMGVYQATLAWTEENGYRTVGPARDVYWQGLAPDANEDNWITEVQFPIEKKPVPIFLPNLKEKCKMDVKIVTKPAFNVIGLLYHGKNEHQEIKALWGDFNQRMGEIKNIVDGCFGVCGANDPNGTFKYVAGMAVSNCDNLPEGMTVWEVPEQQYAVFPTTLHGIGEAYSYAFETWLPQSGYEYTKGPDFEYYDENFDPKDDSSIFYIYIPIQ